MSWTDQQSLTRKRLKWRNSRPCCCC